MKLKLSNRTDGSQMDLSNRIKHVLAICRKSCTPLMNFMCWHVLDMKSVRFFFFFQIMVFLIQRARTSHFSVHMIYIKNLKKGTHINTHTHSQCRFHVINQMFLLTWGLWDVLMTELLCQLRGIHIFSHLYLDYKATSAFMVWIGPNNHSSI